MRWKHYTFADSQRVLSIETFPDDRKINPRSIAQPTSILEDRQEPFRFPSRISVPTNERFGPAMSERRSRNRSRRWSWGLR